jgi:hypothetical protein
MKMAKIIRYKEVTVQRPYPRSGSYQKQAPVVLCGCSEEVICSDFTNTCKCGADYNFAGQGLAPRSQWGEETGESWQEII